VEDCIQSKHFRFVSSSLGCQVLFLSRSVSGSCCLFSRVVGFIITPLSRARAICACPHQHFIHLVTRLAVRPGEQDGPSSMASFNSPQDVAVDAAGDIYVADWGNHCIRKIEAE
jgi:hypothetical protein